MPSSTPPTPDLNADKQQYYSMLYELNDRLIAAFEFEHVQLLAYWRDLERKAQIILTLSGALLIFSANAIRALTATTPLWHYLFLFFNLSIVLCTLVFAVRALHLQSVLVTPKGKDIANFLPCISSRAITASERIAVSSHYLSDVSRIWENANHSLDTELKKRVVWFKFRNGSYFSPCSSLPSRWRSHFLDPSARPRWLCIA